MVGDTVRDQKAALQGVPYGEFKTPKGVGTGVLGAIRHKGTGVSLARNAI